ncbi:YagK/YfjJ domain-containing protein [Chitiniphilus shinanonensis]|uniref:YagK/YfjJ domain-containing protein n=1 Tax=Chitiniphilus shinanonensis TaxID=553088 RepID=UPI00306B8341
MARHYGLLGRLARGTVALTPAGEPGPYLRLLLSILTQATWRGEPPLARLADGRLATEHFNELIQTIRQQARRSDFQRATELWQRVGHPHFQSTEAYLNSLFDQYARLLVVRLDLYYRADSPHGGDGEQSKAHLQQLLNNRRQNSLFEHLVGYLWKLEFGTERGFHYHCVLLFNGAAVREDMTYGDLIGDYWRDVITDGHGSYWNANKPSHHPSWHGALDVGMIAHDDWERRQNLLLKVVSYLAKPDPCLQQGVPEGAKRFRTFGRGEMLRREGVKRGRRRREQKSPLPA